MAVHKNHSDLTVNGGSYGKDNNSQSISKRKPDKVIASTAQKKPKKIKSSGNYLLEETLATGRLLDM